jgi:PAS domain S-box-containing protein
MTGRPPFYRRILARSRTPTAPAAYGVAVSAVLVALLARAALDPVLGNSVPFITFVPAVLIAAAFGGMRPALVALLLSALVAAFWFMPPRGALLPDSGEGWWSLGLFLGIGLAIGLLAEGQRTATHRAESAASAAAERESRYRDLWEQSTEARYVLDLSGRFIDANPAAEMLTGYTRPDLIGRSLTDLLDPESHARSLAMLERKQAGEPVTTYEVEIRTGDGRIRTIEVTSRLIHREGRPPEVHGSAHDITDRKLAEAALRESEERLALAAQSAGFGTYDDRGSGQVFWSPEMKALFGLAPDTTPEEGARTALEMVHADDRVRWLAALAAARDPDGPGEMDIEHRVIRPDGRVVWVAQKGRILFEGEGADRHGVRAIGVVTDITARKEAEAAVRASRDQLDAILASVAEGIAVEDTSGRLLYANAAAARLAGFPTVEAMLRATAEDYRTTFRITDESGAPLSLRDLPDRRAAVTKSPVEAVLGYEIIATGETRWSSVRAVPVLDGDTVRFTVTAFQDITALRRADDAQRRLAAIVSSSDDAIIGKTLDAIVTDWNAAAERMYGYTFEEMAGRSIATIVPLDRRDELAAIMARLRRGEHISHHETERVRKDGARLSVSLTISPIRSASGTIIGAATISRDITARRQAEQERERLAARLQEAYAVLDTLVARAPAGLALFDPQLRFVHINAWLAAQNGRSVEEHLGRALAEILPEDAPVVEPLLRRVLATGEPVLDVEISGPLPADRSQIRHALASYYPARTPDGALLGVGVIVQDVTENRRAAEERERLLAAERVARAEAEASLQMRDEMMSFITHDLRSPLTSVKGYAQMLNRRARREALPEAVIMGLNGIEAGTARIEGLIAELLDTARLEAGQALDLQRRPADLVALTQRCAATHRQTTKQHTIRVDARVSELTGMWDAARLERVIDNLLSNAIKYSPNGGEIIVEVGEQAEDGEHWAVLTVRDEGMGIPAEDLPHVFERFHRGSNVAGHIAGIGIGLSGVKQIVEQHGGSVAVESEEGKGSTFTVRLPLTEPDA